MSLLNIFKSFFRKKEENREDINNTVKDIDNIDLIMSDFNNKELFLYHNNTINNIIVVKKLFSYYMIQVKINQDIDFNKKVFYYNKNHYQVFFKKIKVDNKDNLLPLTRQSNHQNIISNIYHIIDTKIFEKSFLSYNNNHLTMNIPISKNIYSLYEKNIIAYESLSLLEDNSFIITLQDEKSVNHPIISDDIFLKLYDFLENKENITNYLNFNNYYFNCIVDYLTFFIQEYSFTNINEDIIFNTLDNLIYNKDFEVIKIFNIKNKSLNYINALKKLSLEVKDEKLQKEPLFLLYKYSNGAKFKSSDFNFIFNKYNDNKYLYYFISNINYYDYIINLNYRLLVLEFIYKNIKKILSNNYINNIIELLLVEFIINKSDIKFDNNSHININKQIIELKNNLYLYLIFNENIRIEILNVYKNNDEYNIHFLINDEYFEYNIYSYLDIDMLNIGVVNYKNIYDKIFKQNKIIKVVLNKNKVNYIESIINTFILNPHFILPEDLNLSLKVLLIDQVDNYNYFYNNLYKEDSFSDIEIIKILNNINHRDKFFIKKEEFKKLIKLYFDNTYFFNKLDILRYLKDDILKLESILEKEI